jgi:two-component system chemotaxis sensor kinase CheA
MSRGAEDRGAELRTLFFESAYELLQSLNEGGLQLEAHPGDEEVLRGIRRAVHTLKGDAAACGFAKLSELSHGLEDALTPQMVQTRGPAVAEVVLAAADNFGSMLSAYERNVEPPSVAHLESMMSALQQAPAPKASSSIATPEQAASQIEAKFAWTEYEQLMISEAVHRSETVYNLALRIDGKSLMRAAAFQLIRNVLHGCGTVIALRPEDNVAAATVEIVEAAIATNLSFDQLEQRCRIPSIVSDCRIVLAATADTAEHELLDELLEAQAHLTHPDPEHPEGPVPSPGNAVSTAVASMSETSLRVDASRIDAVMNLVGELIIGKSMLNRTLTELNRTLAEFDKNHTRDPIRAKLADAVAFQTRVLDELHKCVLKIRMVPVEQLFRRFPRVVRDVAKQCGKDVALDVAGQNTDLDKGILDALAEPLMHLVRNAVDHGIDSPNARLAAGKPARGTVFLNAYHQGAQVVLEVRDDGRGMDHNKLRAQAVEKGIIKPLEAKRLTEAEALNLIFEPGFSTAEAVTEVSGRGVGMDVVRSVMDKLKGTVRVHTQIGVGTTIELRAPLTLASIQTLLFRVGGRLYAVPLSSVVEITRIREHDTHIIDQREILRLREQLLTLVRLNRLEHIHAVTALPNKKTSFVIVIGTAEKRFGLVVDALVGEEELVIKPLPSDIVASDLVSGASILGDGTVVLILNVPAVVARFSKALPLGATA